MTIVGGILTMLALLWVLVTNGFMGRDGPSDPATAAVMARSAERKLCEARFNGARPAGPAAAGPALLVVNRDGTCRVRVGAGQTYLMSQDVWTAEIPPAALPGPPNADIASGVLALR